MREFRKEMRESVDDMQSEIQESKYSRLKLLGIELLPVAFGASLGGLGRATSVQWIPAIPMGVDLMHNITGYTTVRGIWGLAKYGCGVALAYSDKIYPILQEQSPIIYETLDKLLH